MNCPQFFYQDIVDSNQDTQSQSLKPKLLKIRKPAIKREGVVLTPGTEHILLGSFSMLIVGKPASGKSHFISELIEQPNFYRGKFDRIIYIGPTKYKDVIHDNFNTCTTLDIEFINSKIKQCCGWAENMLIVMDDIISQTPTTIRSRLQQLFFNRRHELPKGTISIIITAQKLTSVPTWIRSSINCLVSFAIPKCEINSLFNQIPLLSKPLLLKQKFSSLTKYEFIFFNLETGKAFDSDFEEI